MKFRLKWFKKKNRTIPENATCRNCGTEMTGRYCHECGQDFFAGEGIPILQLIVQALDNILALEGKTPRTLVNLLFCPGFLSDEYMNGRINRYVHPVKLFWMSTLIFFAIMISQLDVSNFDKDNDFNFKFGEKEINSSSSSDTISKNDDVDYKEIVKLKSKTNITSKEVFTTGYKYFSKYAPYIAFLFIPFFALLLVLFFRKRKIFYVHHLIFTVHFHTFLWIYCSLLLLIKIFFHSQYPNWLSNILFYTPGIYFTFAIHRFYNPNVHTFKSWWQSLWKAVFISILYSVLIIIIFAVLAMLFIKIFYPEVYD